METEMLDEYTTLMHVREEGQICETADGTRVFLIERIEAEHFDQQDGGYPVSRQTLEYCAGWEVEVVHIVTDEQDGIVRYEVDIEEYYDAQFKPVFDEEFATVPLDTIR